MKDKKMVAASRLFMIYYLLFIPGAVSFTTTIGRQTGFTRPNVLFAKKTATLDKDDICTVQILMSDTGGGHRASANALRDAFDVLYPDNRIKCDIVDIYTDYGPMWPYNDYVNGYKLMAANPWMWDIFYHFGCTPFGLWLNDFLLDLFCFDAFTKCLDRDSCDTNKRADMVVSVHPLTQELPLKILSYLDANTKDKSARTTPFVTVVTDLGSAHPTWFNPSVDKCFVPSDPLHKVARDRGLKESQITQHGLPIRKGFWSPSGESKTALKQKLYLDEDKPTVLVVGGGDGMGGIVEISKQLGQKMDANSQMVVVCGKNEKAKNELENISTWTGTVHVKGFVNNMDEYMQASDVLVTKAGPGTIAEASICGLPCMMFSFLPGQEAGNIPYVENNGFGKYSADPAEIAKTVSSWLSSEEKLEEMHQAALKAARPKATIDIARDIAEMLFAHKEKQKMTSEKLQVAS